MAGTIAYDIVEGTGGRKTRTGWIIDRIATVYNITGVSASAVMLEAVAVLENDGVTINSSHPSLATAFLTDFEPGVQSADTFTVRLIYKEFPFGEEIIRVGATTSQVVTNRGFLVNQTTKTPAVALSDMQVKYTFPANYEGVNKERYASKEFTTGVEGPLFIPERTIVITRQEIITGAALSSLARDFVGRTNDGAWDLAPGDGPNTWLCTGIEGISNDNGLTYVITYSFQFRQDEWNHTVIYMDPNTSRPPPDVAFGAGTTISSKNTYAMQDNVDFNGLGLT